MINEKRLDIIENYVYSQTIASTAKQTVKSGILVGAVFFAYGFGFIPGMLWGMGITLVSKFT